MSIYLILSCTAVQCCFNFVVYVPVALVCVCSSYIVYCAAFNDSAVKTLITPRTHAQQGVKQSCCLSLCPLTKHIETAEIRVIRSENSTRGGSRIDLRGGLSKPRALARAKFYVLRPLLTSFPHTTSYTKKK